MRKVLIPILVSMVGQPAVSSADVWADREGLAAIEEEIEKIEILVKDVAGRSNSDGRTSFAFEVLLDDLRKVRSGISGHLAAPMEPVAPLSIDALSTTYTEHQK